MQSLIFSPSCSDKNQSLPDGHDHFVYLYLRVSCVWKKLMDLYIKVWLLPLLLKTNKQTNKFRHVRPDAKPAFGVSILCLLGKQLVSLDTPLPWLRSPPFDLGLLVKFRLTTELAWSDGLQSLVYPIWILKIKRVASREQLKLAHLLNCLNSDGSRPHLIGQGTHVQ